MKRARDSQRQRVYNAEQTLPEFGQNGIALPHIQLMLDTMCASPLWKARYPSVQRILVKDGRGRRRACGSPSGRYIKMPVWTRSELIILHEVAHVVAPYSVTIPWHGWQFCTEYIWLVHTFMGEEVAERLKEAMLQERVKFQDPESRR